MRTHTLLTNQQLGSFLDSDCVIVVAVVKSALCSQAVSYLESFLPPEINIVLVNIYDHPDFQRDHRVTVVPTGYVYKRSQLVNEFKLPFNQDQILCWIK